MATHEMELPSCSTRLNESGGSEEHRIGFRKSDDRSELITRQKLSRTRATNNHSVNTNTACSQSNSNNITTSWQQLLWCSIIFIVLFLSPSIGAVEGYRVFHNPLTRSDKPFQKMTVDHKTGRIYIGGVNRIHELGTDLTKRATVVTGPKKDNPACASSTIEDNNCAGKVDTDSHTKALTIDTGKGRLLVCTSLFQGVCWFRYLYNITMALNGVTLAVAANDANSSTVAVVAPGPEGKMAIYVASTSVFGPHASVRANVPAVATLKAELPQDTNQFSFMENNIRASTHLTFQSRHRPNFIVHYVHAFSSGNFTYFVARQPRTPKIAEIRTRFIRICHNDATFYSYTEIPVVCSTGGRRTGNGGEYNFVRDAYVAKPGFDLAKNLKITPEDDVLFLVMSKGASGASARQSALCLFSLKQIDETFFNNIKTCNKGNAPIGLEWFKSDRGDCNPVKLRGQQLLCGNEANPYIAGIEPIETQPVLTTDDARFTSVVATDTHGYTVAFIGTEDGRVKKAVIETQTSGFEFDSEEVSNGRPILPDMELDISGEYLLVLTADSLIRMKVQTCDQYQRCPDCLAALDPYCGWCPLEQSCTVKTTCDSKSDSARWIPYKDQRCTAISGVVPEQVQIIRSDYLRLSIVNLPALVDKQYSCVFTFKSFPKRASLITGATRQDDNVRCPTPDTKLLPPIPEGEHALVANLAVSVDNGPEFASTNFTFYDCTTYTTCTECASSPYACDWCVDSNQCSGSIDNDCRSQTIVIGRGQRPGQSTRRGPEFCPRIEIDQPDMYVPAGATHKIVVRARNLQTSSTPLNLECHVQMEGAIHKRTATLNGDGDIACEPMVFNYYGDGLGNGTDVAKVSVFWQKSKQLDNNQNIRVIMYKCERLATSCGLCVTLNTSQFSCGWCNTNKQCAALDRCPRRSDADSVPAGLSHWLDGNSTCPHPAILDFYPKSGPTEGGTNVTIVGVNLGRNFEEIQNAVHVSGVKCTPIRELYEIATKIVCTTAQPNPPTEFGKEIIVKLGDSMLYANTSRERYHTVNPKIVGFNPVAGPMSGGTHIRIEGEHLNAGSGITVRVASVPCNVTSRGADYIICITGAATIKKSGIIEMVMDKKATRRLMDPHFTYAENPTVFQLKPSRSIVSGGLKVNVTGEGLKLLQRPKMQIGFKQEMYSGPECKIFDNTLMQCITPNLEIPPTQSDQPSVDSPERLTVSMNLDGRIVHLTNPIDIVPDPQILRFESLRYYRADDHLTINGKYIDEAASAADVKVQIGTSWCNITSVSDTLITCKPPSQTPGVLDPENEHPEIVVLIGQNRQYAAGQLSYSSDGPSAVLTTEIIIAIACAIGAFLIAIVALGVALMRKSKKQKQNEKRWRERMDQIEMRVASECKEAFAELQTNMDFLMVTSDMSMGIPLLPYRDYVAQVLFPNSSPVNHPALRELEVDPHRAEFIEKGLNMFNHLLMNKTFVLLFIRTMESNKYFLSKDRVYVGSLLMVILQEKMEYCTDILKTLMAELIERTVDRRSQPKILFRRSESVAERMLAAWFTFLMHRYLTECAGRPLFMLYWALKQEVEKGPHDAVTHEARYSLSEEKLLRATVDYHEMTLFVTADPSQSVEIPARVLDCDTITQVKEKCLDALYRTTPFSQRPSATDLDLEWRTGGAGGRRNVLQVCETCKAMRVCCGAVWDRFCVVLADRWWCTTDYDNTTRTEPGGWKKLNTLAHYNVPSNSSVALVPRQASMYNLSLRSEISEKSSTFSLKNSPTLTRAFARSNEHKDPETGCKMYHLAKTTEPMNGASGHHGSGADQNPLNKQPREIYLTRLATVKGTVKNFIEDLFEAIFSTAHRGSTLPLAVKYMFDFMDDQAHLHGYTDPEVVHTWKSNALPLRFWVNLIKNPQFVFDIPRADKIEGSLSVVAQALMDACSTQQHQFNKAAPSSKLLFAKDMDRYRDWVHRYYQDIASIAPISDQDMNAFLAEESRNHTQQFFVYSALNELYKYLQQYKDQVAVALDEDEFAQRARLPRKFAEMVAVMDGDMYGGAALPR